MPESVEPLPFHLARLRVPGEEVERQPGVGDLPAAIRPSHGAEHRSLGADTGDGLRRCRDQERWPLDRAGAGAGDLAAALRGGVVERPAAGADEDLAERGIVHRRDRRLAGSACGAATAQTSTPAMSQLSDRRSVRERPSTTPPLVHPRPLTVNRIGRRQRPAAVGFTAEAYRARVTSGGIPWIALGTATPKRSPYAERLAANRRWRAAAGRRRRQQVVSSRSSPR